MVTTVWSGVVLRTLCSAERAVVSKKAGPGFGAGVLGTLGPEFNTALVGAMGFLVKRLELRGESGV
jgi:hypothetical protein